jgi:RNA polymerase sigma factor (sigma-70 family)
MPRSTEDFAQIYNEHVWDVYGFFGYRVGSREEAEDLTQQTFEKAMRAWRRYDPRRARAKTWLLAIAHNLLIDHYRRGRGVREEPLADERTAEEHHGESPGADAGLGLSPELDAALSALGDRERELIALRFGGDLDGAQIARIMQISVDNVHQILSRSLRRLRAELGSQSLPGAASEAATPRH